MALVLPPPTNDRQTLAQALIRRYEATAPLTNVTLRGPWLVWLLNEYGASRTTREIAECATAVVCRALPEPTRSIQWACMTYVRCQPPGQFSMVARIQLRNVIDRLAGLAAYAAQVPTPPRAGFDATADLIDVTAALSDGDPLKFAPTDFAAARAGYSQLARRYYSA